MGRGLLRFLSGGLGGCGCAAAAPRLRACFAAADAGDGVEDAGANMPAKAACLGYVSLQGAKQVPLYCSVPLRPSPPPCQPRIPNNHDLKLNDNIFYFYSFIQRLYEGRERNICIYI